MEWIKVTAHTTAGHIEPLTALLIDHGVQGVEIIDPREYSVFLEQDKKSWDYVDAALAQLPTDDAACVVFYLSADAPGEAALDIISAALADSVYVLRITSERVNDENWLHEWKKYFTTIRAGRVAIVPAWEDAPQPPADVTFILDPGSAFGTGQHATTFLCVEALQEYVRPDALLLDAGCGSGILAIVGLLLGADKAVACDIDPSAISATHKNAALNGITPSRLQVLHGNLLTDTHLREVVSAQKYDVIVANIVADVVIALLPLVPALLHEGGHFIASGIIDERGADVRDALAPNGLKLVDEQLLDGWHCLVCTHA